MTDPTPYMSQVVIPLPSDDAIRKRRMRLFLRAVGTGSPGNNLQS